MDVCSVIASFKLRMEVLRDWEGREISRGGFRADFKETFIPAIVVEEEVVFWRLFIGVGSLGRMY